MSLISCKLDNKNTNQRTRSIIDYPVKFYNINSPYDTIIFESDSLGFLSNKSTKKDFTYWYSTDKDSLFISPYYSRDLWFKLTLFKDSLALVAGDRNLSYYKYRQDTEHFIPDGTWKGSICWDRLPSGVDENVSQMDKEAYFLRVNSEEIEITSDDTKVISKSRYDISVDGAFIYNDNKPRDIYSIKQNHDTLSLRKTNHPWKFIFIKVLEVEKKH